MKRPRAKSTTRVPAKTRAQRVSLTSARTTTSYKKVAILFTVIVTALAGVIIYFSFTKTIITVTPAPVAQTVTSIVRVAETVPEEQGETITISGKLLTETISDSITTSNLTPSGEVADIAKGTVTIYNNWSQTQPLQATTRLLSTAGVLFRIENRVDVPAKGKVEHVPVYADQAGAEGNIAPTRFTIPGLWEGLRDDIYAESDEAMSGGTRNAKIVTEEDISQLRKQLITQSEGKALDAFTHRVDEQSLAFRVTSESLIEQVILEENISHTPGQETDSLTIDRKTRFTALAIDYDELHAYLETELRSKISPDLKIADLKNEDIAYTVSASDTEAQTAELRVTVSVQTAIRLSSPIFDRQKLLAKDAQQISTYFSTFDEVQSVEIDFSPFWLKRTPSLLDHLEIRINEISLNNTEGDTD